VQSIQHLEALLGVLRGWQRHGERALRMLRDLSVLPVGIFCSTREDFTLSFRPQ